MELLIANIRLFTNVPGEPIRDNQAVIIGDGQVKAMGPEKEMVKLCTGCRKIDGEGKLVMPGLINCHMHLYSTFARGIAINEAAHGFPEILKKLWWRLDSSLDEEAVYYSALVPAITAVKRGVTAMIDHHAGPNAVDGSLDRIEAALRQVGLRATLCYEVSDRDGKEIAQQGLRENERYIKKCKLLPNGLFHGMMGLHASFTVNNDTLTEAAQIARNQDVGCHIHLAEDISDAQLSMQHYLARPVQRLQEAGVLGPRTIAAHGIHLDPEEIDILNASQSMIVHNPQSNMNNAVGRTDIFQLLQKGILIGLGTDGMSADIRPDIRTGNLIHKHHLKDNNVAWQEISEMVLKNNPAIYQRVSGQQVGQLGVGSPADLIIVDYYPPTPLTAENFWGHFLFGIADADVDTTIINGEVVMEKKVIPGIDEEKIAAESRSVAENVWKRFEGEKQ